MGLVPGCRDIYIVVAIGRRNGLFAGHSWNFAGGYGWCLLAEDLSSILDDA